MTDLTGNVKLFSICNHEKKDGVGGTLLQEAIRTLRPPAIYVVFFLSCRDDAYGNPFDDTRVRLVEAYDFS